MGFSFCLPLQEWGWIPAHLRLASWSASGDSKILQALAGQEWPTLFSPRQLSKCQRPRERRPPERTQMCSEWCVAHVPSLSLGSSQLLGNSSLGPLSKCTQGAQGTENQPSLPVSGWALHLGGVFNLREGCVSNSPAITPSHESHFHKGLVQAGGTQ